QHGAPTDFEPSPKQRALIAALQADGYGGTVTEACRIAGICRDTYYDWMDDDAYCEWFQAQVDHYFALKRGDVMGAMVRSAKGESLPGASDRKLFLERYDRGYMPRTHQVQEVHQEGPTIADARVIETLEKLTGEIGKAK
ncbi:unnamed protein product, partial [marine sediment metagenome]